MTASKLASEAENSWDSQEGHKNFQLLWMGYANCPFLSQIDHKQQASTENEDTQQASLHNYDKESMVQTLSPCPTHELRPCLGLALFLSGMGWLIPSDSLKSQTDATCIREHCQNRCGTSCWCQDKVTSCSKEAPTFQKLTLALMTFIRKEWCIR